MRKAVMYGAGNIGRGFIGELFSESGYEVVFIDINNEIINKLNKDGKYPVNILTGTESKEIIVENVRGVNGIDTDKVSEEIAMADIMATAVGVNVLPRIVNPIVLGLRRRWQEGNLEPLNIIICENLIDSNQYLSTLIKLELNEVERINFDKLIGLVEASIGRMVPVMTPEMQAGNILRICVEEYGMLPVDKDGFKGEIPYIKNMKPFSPFNFYIQRKLYIHNMGHALTAYLGKLKGYTYIWEAIKDPSIKIAVLRAMQDSAIALSLEHGIKLEILLAHVEDLIFRFSNKQLGDTVSRVGNDTKRKLSENDRFIGAAKFCIKHNVNPANICLGIAAAMKFDSLSNLSVVGLSEMIAEGGPSSVIEKICGLTDESIIGESVLEFYSLIDQGTCVDEIINMTGEFKRRKVI